MTVAVHGDLVPPLDRLHDDLRSISDRLTNHKEGAASARFFQQVENNSSVHRVGTIVEGQGDSTRPRSR
jgi:hypothetical protein